MRYNNKKFSIETISAYKYSDLTENFSLYKNHKEIIGKINKAPITGSHKISNITPTNPYL